MTDGATWLPNLVGGVSIWKLAIDLNEPKFFDGRLLVPETEGSESLPVTVRWDLTGLIPLKEAYDKHPGDTGNAVKDFQACLEKVAKIFSTPNSGFDKYKSAFTVPSIEADGGANYFYSPEKKKLYAINWGASPRTMGGKAQYVFGYEDWGKHWGDPLAVAGSGSAPAIPVAAAVAAAPVKIEEKKEEKKDEKKEEKKEDRGRWWLWPLFALIAIALLLLAMFLLRSCDEKTGPNADAAADALAEGGGEGGANEAGAEGGADAMADALADAMGDGGDAGADANATDGGDAGKDGGKDGGKLPDGGPITIYDDDDDDDGPSGSSSSGGASSSGGGGGGKIIVKVGPGGGAKTSVHRKHYSDDAVKWRVSAGQQKVSRTEQNGHRFDVWLTPGQTFEGVRVEWQDSAGKWHVH